MRNTLISGNFGGAFLFNCDLSSAITLDADFEGAAFDETTKWPLGGTPPGAKDYGPMFEAARRRVRDKLNGFETEA